MESFKTKHQNNNKMQTVELYHELYHDAIHLGQIELCTSQSDNAQQRTYSDIFISDAYMYKMYLQFYRTRSYYIVCSTYYH